MKKYLSLCAILCFISLGNPIFAKVTPTNNETVVSESGSASKNLLDVEVRQMNKSKLQEFRGEKDFSYTHNVAKKQATLPQKTSKLPVKESPSLNLEPMWNIFVACMIALCIFLILWGVFGRQVSEIFFKKASPLSSDENMMEQDIKLADFDTLISNSVKAGEYRKAVRMLYLEALKVLTLNQWIVWKPNKTNQDYLNELQLSPFKRAFADLTLQFEYIWYGDFQVNEAIYVDIRNQFLAFSNQYNPL